VTLVNGRDLDRAEAEALAGSKVTHVSVAELDADRLPEGPKVLPIDVDIIDPAQLGRLRFPAPGGPSLQDVVDAVRAVVHDRPLAALDIAVTWRPQDTTRAQTDAVLSALLWSIQPHP
jgi:arginase